jgi:hypothetical protein
MEIDLNTLPSRDAHELLASAVFLFQIRLHENWMKEGKKQMS